MQEYMRDKRWEARSKAETTTYEDEIHPQCPPKPTISRAASRQRRQIKRESVDSSSSTSVNDQHTTLSQLKEASHTPVHATAHHVSAVPWHQPIWSGTDLQLRPIKKDFYLNAQSFAALADIFPIEPPSPTHTITSGSSLSPPASVKEGEVSPLSILSAARTDPFDALPMRLDATDQELFDFYAVVMPSCSYGFERRHHKAHNWYRDVFIPEAMKGPVTFKNTILVHAANTKAWVLGLDESPLALHYRHKAISALEQHYAAHPDDVSDEVITATMSAAALEDFDPRAERRPIAWMHWTAAMHKIRLAGGPAQLEYKPSLRKLVNWQDYIFSGYDGRGSTFYFTPEAIFNSIDESERERRGRQEIIGQCEEFLTFLKCTEHLATVAASQSQNPVARQNQRLRYTIFSQNHPLHILLASPNKDRYTKAGQLKQIISRLGSLITINTAIWEYRYDTSLSEAFFDELVHNIMYNELDKNVSIEALMQILLSGSDNPALRHTERPWLVGRLLKVAKRLSKASWEWLNDFLLSSLTLDGKSRMQMQELEEFLRYEILQAPLVSHKLPLMQS